MGWKGEGEAFNGDPGWLRLAAIYRYKLDNVQGDKGVWDEN